MSNQEQINNLAKKFNRIRRDIDSIAPTPIRQSLDALATFGYLIAKRFDQGVFDSEDYYREEWSEISENLNNLLNQERIPVIKEKSIYKWFISNLKIKFKNMEIIKDRFNHYRFGDIWFKIDNIIFAVEIKVCPHNLSFIQLNVKNELESKGIIALLLVSKDETIFQTIQGILDKNKVDKCICSKTISSKNHNYCPNCGIKLYEV